MISLHFVWVAGCATSTTRLWDLDLCRKRSSRSSAHRYWGTLEYRARMHSYSSDLFTVFPVYVSGKLLWLSLLWDIWLTSKIEWKMDMCCNLKWHSLCDITKDESPGLCCQNSRWIPGRIEKKGELFMLLGWFIKELFVTAIAATNRTGVL